MTIVTTRTVAQRETSWGPSVRPGSPRGCETPADRALGRCFLVINPGSRNGHSQEVAALYRKLLAAGVGKERVAFDYCHTGSLEDARTLARHALTDGYDTIVAVGGDGTINRVVSAFVDSMADEGQAARLGILYSGTSPDFCRFHGIPTDPVAAVEALRRGVSRAIDVCRITHQDSSGRTRVDAFACSANIGLGAGIAARANRLRPRLGDLAGTLLASVITIAGRGPQRVRLTVDGEEIAIGPALNITVGKNPHIASGLKLDAKVTAADGRLFVFAICRIGRAGLLRALPRIYSGSIARDPRFVLRYARCVRVEPLEGTLRTEFDGDPAGWCPAEIRVIPKAVRLIGAGS
jgi:diacylglycerol kinase family enzyme